MVGCIEMSLGIRLILFCMRVGSPQNCRFCPFLFFLLLWIELKLLNISAILISFCKACRYRYVVVVSKFC